jgi:asparagine synthase (glutamine-hydrolysing)
VSAIFGLVRQDDGQVDRRDLENMSRALTVHGAYGGASWAVRTAGLGQRLTRLTPEDRFEQQPVVSVDGRLTLVFAGRLDNRPELLSELGRGPSAAEVTPDSAILLRALERWGQACVSHLIGDFAFAVWDARQQQLFLARSPLGVHPILYSCGASTFAFATMPKGLFALPFVSRELDSERLADFLVSAPADPEGAFYRGIRRLPAGHCMWVSKRRQEVRRYWARPAETDEAADSTCVETVRSLFDRAVSDRLRCISSVGVMMSGGLDSASVAASAAESLGNERLSTFTEGTSQKTGMGRSCRVVMLTRPYTSTRCGNAIPIWT